ncbi:hypothetical protein [Desertivirga arenae]|uniref:hypothetical protein n=1 Tax=Desertivirga arenae TaxID=2810309 RepID=UPI001A965B5F|nr:hypothetical protein [Pedobacter sp. SYSU D00823]
MGINYYTSESLQRIANKWAAKEYKAYEPSDKLYLMKALDFYNSKELNNYIDSIRKIEYGKLWEASD